MSRRPALPLTLRRAVLATLVAALALTLLAPPAQARWHATQVISDRHHANRVPVTAGDGRGAALVAWERSPADPAAPPDLAIMVRRRDRLGHWSRRRRVSPLMQFGGNPMVAMNPHGDGAVLYAQVVSGFVNRIVVRRVRPTGRLGKPRVVAKGEFVLPDSLTIDGAGDIVVVWDVQHDAWHLRILRAGDGGRTLTTDFPAGVSVLSPPALTSRDSHRVAVAWSEGTVHTALVSRAGRLRHDRVVSDPADVGMPASVTPHLCQDGTVVVSWYRFDTPSDGRGLVAWLRPDGTVLRRVVTGRAVDVAQLVSGVGARERVQVGWERGGVGPAYTRSATPRGALGRRHLLVDSTLGVELTGQPPGGGMLTWLDSQGAGHYATYTSTGRISRRGHAPDTGATVVPLGRHSYLGVALRNEAGGQATHLVADIGP